MYFASSSHQLLLKSRRIQERCFFFKLLNGCLGIWFLTQLYQLKYCSLLKLVHLRRNCFIFPLFSPMHLMFTMSHPQTLTTTNYNDKYSRRHALMTTSKSRTSTIISNSQSSPTIPFDVKLRSTAASNNQWN